MLLNLLRSERIGAGAMMASSFLAHRTRTAVTDLVAAASTFQEQLQALPVVDPSTDGCDAQQLGEWYAWARERSTLAPCSSPHSRACRVARPHTVRVHSIVCSRVAVSYWCVARPP